MAWDSDSLYILRVLLDDLDEDAPRYSDDKLISLSVVAAYQLKQELDFDITYTINLSAETITPDPSSDEAFMNLMTLKAACSVNRGELLVAANRAIAVRDGKSSVDLRGVSDQKLKVIEKGWCAAYADARLDYLKAQAGVSRLGGTVAGAAVLSPFRLFARTYFGTPIPR